MSEEQMIARQQKLLNIAKNEQRDLTAEEQAEYDSLQRSLDEINKRRSTPQNQTASQRAAIETGTGSQTSGVPERNLEDNQRSMQQERSRVVEIMNLCRSFNMDPGKYISGGQTIDQVRQAVLDKLQRDNAPSSARVTADEGDKFRERASDALMMRSGVQVEHPAEGAQQLRNMSLRDLAVECLSREGQDAMALLRMSSDALYG